MTSTPIFTVHHVANTAQVGVVRQGSMVFLPPQIYAIAPAEDKDERYTLDDTKAWILRMCGTDMFDLDVAACEQSHLADLWYGKKEDGLVQPWIGRVFCNPPFSGVWAWVEKAWKEFASGRAQLIALLMPANRQEQKGWQEMVEPYRDGRHPEARLTTHYPPGRVVYGTPEDPKGENAGSPPFGSCLLVWQHRASDPGSHP